MKTIWKFPLMIANTFEIPMPEGAQVLSVQIQAGDPIMWAMVEPRAPVTVRRFRVIGTGRPILDARLAFIGTFQYGPLVFHLFEATA